MRKALFILLLFVVCLIPALASADYIVDDQIFSGDFAAAKDNAAEVYFNQNGNDFGGKIFFQNIQTVPLTQVEILGGAQKNCTKQLRGFYINSARGNMIRPLDQDSLVHLQSIDSSYDNISLTGGLFICNDLANSIVGYIQHTRNGEIYSLIAGLEYDFPENGYLPLFQSGGNFFFQNGITSGYLRDSYGGIAQIAGSGLNDVPVCGNGIVEDSETCDEGTTNGQVNHCNLACNGIVVHYVGGGGGGTLPDPQKDVCPDDRDCSPSHYDGLCGACNVVNVPIAHPSYANLGLPITDPSYSTELNQAYQFAFGKGITTKTTIKKADMTGELIRSYMAKMMVNYAVYVLGQVPDTGLDCTFDDISSTSKELKFYIKLACQLGLMGIQENGIPQSDFNPNGKVTRAQFGTVLSRILYGEEFDGGIPYYKNHLDALKKAGIIKKINPTIKELKGYVMLMLMRATNN